MIDMLPSRRAELKNQLIDECLLSFMRAVIGQAADNHA